MINSESYNNLRLFNSVDSHFYDSLEDRHVPVNILYIMPYKSDITSLMLKIFTLLLSLGTVILAYLLLKKHNMNEKIIWVIMLLLIVSPIFIYTFIDFNMYSIIIFMSLLATYMLISDHKIFGSIIFFIMPFIDVYGSVISCIFLTLYLVARNESFKGYKTFMILGISAIILSVVLNTVLGYNFISSMPFQKSNMITDIGADIGFSFSSIILSAIGLILLWEKGWKNLALYSSIILFMFVAVFNTFLRVYLNLILVIYAGFAFVYLTRRKWSIPIIKKITILLIICSVLFTTLVYVNKLVKAEPNTNYVDALKFIKQQSFNDEGILSSEKNGFLIEYYGERKTLIDDKTISYNASRLALLENISTSRNLERTGNMLTNNSIKYIFIDSDFKQYLEEKQGLLFLMETSNDFKNIYQNQNVEVWMYVK